MIENCEQAIRGIITIYIFSNPMTALQFSSVATAASNGDPTNLKIHLDVPNGSVGFRNTSYDYATEVWIS